MSSVKKLAKLFMLIGENELKIEFARQNLCRAPAFEPYAAFQRIDRANRGYLDAKDIVRFMKDNGFSTVGELECNHVIKFFDSSSEGRLYFSDFLQILLPCDHSELRAEVT